MTNPGLHSVAAYLLRSLEIIFQQAGISGNPETPAKDTPPQPVISELTVEQACNLKQGLQQLTYQLPNQLYNAGVTPTLLPASDIHLNFYGNYLNLFVVGYGNIMIDLEDKNLHALMWQPDGYETAITGTTHKQDLQFRFDADKGTRNGTGYLAGNLKDYPEDKLKQPSQLPRMKSSLMQYRKLLRRLADAHPIYRELFKDPAFKDVLDSSPMSDIKDIAMAQQHKGHQPGVDEVPDDTVVTGKEFAGAYAHPETVNRMKQAGTIESTSTRLTSSFTHRPYDNQQQPDELFIYFRNEMMQEGYIDFTDVGVIYINPADDKK